MFTGIYHVGYWTDDIEAAKALYQRLFGAETYKDALGPDGKTKMAFLRLGQTEVEFIEPHDKAVLNGQTGIILHHIGYIVPNIEAAVQDLAAKGVKFQAEKPHVTPTGVRIIYLDTESTNGARMHLTEL